MGGSSKRFMLQQMQRQGCHLLVGTPGRLNDLLSDEYSGVRAPKLSAFVLDEADRLLDDGFSMEIREIQKRLPDREEVDRQTLMFSATVPREVMQMVRTTMKPDFKFVRTVKEGEQPTHERVPQKIVVTEAWQNNLPALLELCKRELERSAAPGAKPFKALVYFSTTVEVLCASELFRNLRKPGSSQFGSHPLHPARILEIHSKLTQAGRTNAADAFRSAKSAILISSDVTARGMDFPDVTHVIQMGLPQSKDTYIHRIGRTGRGEKTGEGWLIINPIEVREARNRLGDLPLDADRSLQTATVDMTQDAQLPENIAETLKQVGEAGRSVNRGDQFKLYLALIGGYRWLGNQGKLVEALNTMFKYGWGWETPPSVPPELAHKLGLSKVPGLVIGTDRPGRSLQDNPLRGRGAGMFGRSDASSYERKSSSYGDRDRGGRDFGSRGGFASRGGGSGYGGGRDAGASGFGTRDGARGGSRGGFGGGFGGQSGGGDRRSGFGGGFGASSRGGDRDHRSSGRENRGW